MATLIFLFTYFAKRLTPWKIARWKVTKKKEFKRFNISHTFLLNVNNTKDRSNWRIMDMSLGLCLLYRPITKFICLRVCKMVDPIFFTFSSIWCPLEVAPGVNVPPLHPQVTPLTVLQFPVVRLSHFVVRTLCVLATIDGFLPTIDGFLPDNCIHYKNCLHYSGQLKVK